MFLLLAFVVVAFAQETEKAPEVPVVKPLNLSPTNVDSAIASKSLLLVEFYASWCAPCKQFAPEY